MEELNTLLKYCLKNAPVLDGFVVISSKISEENITPYIGKNDERILNFMKIP